jgi:hypothetical protein
VIAGRDAPGVSIQVLTHDTGKHAHDTMVALCKKMLQLVEPACQTQRIEFEPAREAARHVVNANRWKGGKKHRERVDLLKTIATKIGERNGFVFFHVDGDCAWSRRDATDAREKQLETLIRQPLRALLLASGVRGQPMSGPEVENLLARMQLLIPFYSVEAWLYQNIDVAIALCQAHHGGKDADRFASWRERRHELDELERPKQQLCLQDRHNKELAETAYPARAVYELGASFAATVDSLRACGALCLALRAIVPGA